MNSAIIKFGNILSKSNNIQTVGNSPSFSWAEVDDVVITGEAPEDYDGRVCLVKLPDEEQNIFVRLFKHGKKVRAYYMDNYEFYKEYPASEVVVKSEVLAIVHLYDKTDEAPKAATAWERRVKASLKSTHLPIKDYDKIVTQGVVGRGRYESLNVAYCLGAEAARKEARKNDAGRA